VFLASNCQKGVNLIIRMVLAGMFDRNKNGAKSAVVKISGEPSFMDDAADAQEVSNIGSIRCSV
jgi:hypothetical protein